MQDSEFPKLDSIIAAEIVTMMDDRTGRAHHDPILSFVLASCLLLIALTLAWVALHNDGTLYHARACPTAWFEESEEEAGEPIGSPHHIVGSSEQRELTAVHSQPPSPMSASRV